MFGPDDIYWRCRDGCITFSYNVRQDGGMVHFRSLTITPTQKGDLYTLGEELLPISVFYRFEKVSLNKAIKLGFDPSLLTPKQIVRARQGKDEDILS